MGPWSLSVPGPELRYKSSGVFRIQTSDVRGPFRTQNPRKSQKQWSVRKLFTLLGCFLNFFEKMFKNTFKPCSHIELNTQNPNPIFKITICFTKYTKNAKIHSIFWKISRKSKIHIFQKIRFQNDQRFIAIFMARLWRA